MTTRIYAAIARRSPRPKVQVACEHCGTTFLALPSQRERGNARYCSHGCKGEARTLRFWLQRRQSFFDHVDVRGPDDCWEWTATRSLGYGRIGDEWAHRISYELEYKQAPGEMWVLHRCDNPPCVNPKHLFLGTQQDNTADMVQKGRGNSRPPKVRGERHGQARLTDNTVRHIRETYARRGKTQQQIADEYGVHIMTINAVVHRRTWTHV